MELVGGTHNEQLDRFFPMELGSSTHSESSDDLLVWCIGADDFESDTSLTSRIMETDSITHAQLISNTDTFPAHQGSSSSVGAPLIWPEPLHRTRSLWERPWFITTQHHRHHSDSPVRGSLAQACPSINPQSSVDYIEPDICHRSSLELGITTDRSTSECSTSVNPPVERMNDDSEHDSPSTPGFLDNGLRRLSDRDVDFALLSRAEVCSSAEEQCFTSESSKPSKRSSNGFLACDRGASASVHYEASTSGVPQSETVRSSGSGSHDCSESAKPATAPFPLVPDQLSLPTSSGSVMLCQRGELASGDTLTCMLVNVLRGLRLLDRCGVEDLCATLCDLHSMNQSVLDSKQYESCSPSDIRILGDRRSSTEAVIRRSSSFTSSSLVSPRHSRAHEHRHLPNAAFQNAPRSSAGGHAGYCCIVDFILKCSVRGSSAAPPSQDIRSKRGVDWRRGRANNVVTMFTTGASNSRSSQHARSTHAIHKLLTGRFLPGPTVWRSVWPWTDVHSPLTVNQTLTPAPVEELAHWLRVWISRGAAILLAELACPQQIKKAEESQEGNNAPTTTWSELIWRHRLVYGVTERNEAFLSNPEELVPLANILHELARQTTLGLEKSELLRLWSEHQRSHKNPGLPSRQPAFGDPDSQCTGDFSSLASQMDPRWCQLNVLGQVIQTLRILDNSSRNTPTPGHFASQNTTQLDQPCLSPVIHIPCSQSPGFSVFVARADWELCHALHGSRRLFE